MSCWCLRHRKDFMSATHSLHSLLEKWADGEKPTSFRERLLSGGLRLLSWGWAAAATLRGWSYGMGLLRSRRVDCPVFCVGNLTAGGTGKTPVVVETAEYFRDSGRKVAVVSRGYGRADESRTLVVRDYEAILSDQAEAGDEPHMMARLLPGVVIIVGANRHEAATLARVEYNVEVIILDDGFQHRRFYRDCNIVLWDTLRSPGDAAYIPRGFLREGFRALRRARALLFTRCNIGKSARPFLARIKRRYPGLYAFHASLKAVTIYPLSGECAGVSPESLQGESVAAFCGLGNPDSFWNLLEYSGMDLVWREAFPDHHRPDAEELDAVFEKARLSGAEKVLITEKDRENFPKDYAPLIPIWVVSVANTFGEERLRYQAFLEREFQSARP